MEQDQNNLRANLIDNNPNQNENVNQGNVSLGVNQENVENIPLENFYNFKNLETKEKFLFLFTIEKLSYEFLCGISLRVGIQIISILFLGGSLTNFFKTFSEDNIFSKISSLVVFLIYFIAGFCFVYSSIYLNVDYAYWGLIIYTVLFYILLLQNFFVFFLLIFRIFSPIEDADVIVFGFLFLLIVTFIIGIHLYFLWICYSYWFHLKNKNYRLINGDIYKPYRDYRRVDNPNVYNPNNLNDINVNQS